jgi:hypothetical protein
VDGISKKLEEGILVAEEEGGELFLISKSPLLVFT